MKAEERKSSEVLRPAPGRVPPHDLDAEAAVLSVLLLQAERYDEVAHLLLGGAAFYSDQNRVIYEAIVTLRESGRPVDSVTVTIELRATEKLGRAGGSPYIGMLIGEIPSVANIVTCAETVRDRYTKRQLISRAQTIAAETYTSAEPATTLVLAGEAALGELALGGLTNPLVRVGPVLDTEVERLTAASKLGLTFTGIDTGFAKLNRMTAGLHGGDLTVVAGRPGMGKMQPLTAKVLTPSGWTTMGALRIGDTVLGADGRPCTVTGVFDHGERDVYRVTMSDGGSTLCGGEHLWLTRNRSERRRDVPGSVRDTDELRATLQRADSGGLNHSIPYMEPAEFSGGSALPIDPWVLGVFLGDGDYSSAPGSVRITNPEPDIYARVMERLPASDECSEPDAGHTFRIRKRNGGRDASATATALQLLGLRGCRSWEKFIPPMFLVASTADREKLLQGLCDADGFVTDPDGAAVEYVTTSERLREDIAFLARSLGGRVTWTSKRGRYTKDGETHEVRLAYRMNLSFPSGAIVPVSSWKHVNKYRPGRKRIRERFIKSIEPAGREVCRCIAVSAPDHLYVTDDFIVTHNTAFVLNVCANVARAKAEIPGRGVAFFSLEMPKEQLALRLACAEQNIDFTSLRTGHIPPATWNSLTDAAQCLKSTPIWIDDTPGITMQLLRARARQIQRDIRRERVGIPSGELGLIVLDYMQLAQGVRLNGDSREAEVSSISRALKELAKELGVAVMALSQLNRAVEKRGGEKKPELSDLRESGAIEQDADNIWFLYRADYYDKQAPQGEAELGISKQRNGATGTVPLFFRKPSMRFYDRVGPGGEDDEIHEDFQGGM